MFWGFYTPYQYQYGHLVNIQLTVSKGHFFNLDPGSGHAFFYFCFGLTTLCVFCWEEAQFSLILDRHLEGLLSISQILEEAPGPQLSSPSWYSEYEYPETFDQIPRIWTFSCSYLNAWLPREADTTQWLQIGRLLAILQNISCCYSNSGT